VDFLREHGARSFRLREEFVDVGSGGRGVADAELA
jgi:hypothetical protein